MTETTVQVAVEAVTELKGADRHDLCDAAEAAIRDGGGFGWLRPPPRHVLEAYLAGRAAGSRAQRSSSPGSTA